ncbi:MAG: ABC transporter substrate-binding protein [Syntrophomonadaceae bacterium]
MFKYRRPYGYRIRPRYSLPYKRIAVAAGLVLLAVAGFFALRQAVYVNSLSSRPMQVAVVEAIDNLQPALLANHAQVLAASAVYEGLVYYDEKSREVKPLLADKWEYSEDGKVLTIELKKDIVFSSGRPVTAAAVKSAWERNMISTGDWSNQCLYLRIGGAGEYLTGKLKEIWGIEATGERTLKITLNNPDGAFIYALTNPIFWVIDTAVEPERGAAYPGTGPYTVQQQAKDSLILLRNDGYHQGLPHLAAVNFTRYQDEEKALAAYKEGKVDFLDRLPLAQLPALNADKNYQDLLVQKPLMEVYWLGFNLNYQPFANNYLLRRALNYAIDRETIIKNVLGDSCLPAKGVLPTGVAAYNEHVRGYVYDPDKVQQLLADAGYPGGKGLKPLTLTVNNDPGHRQVALEVARQLGLQGITVQVVEQDWGYYTKQITNMRLSFFRLGWKADYADADNFLYTLFHSSTAGSNLVGYKNPQVDKLLDDARAQYKDEGARIKLLKRAEEIVVDDAPCLWLFQKKSTVLLGRDVRDFQVDCMERVNWAEMGISS